MVIDPHTVRKAFPEIKCLDDPLQKRVIDVWVAALRETGNTPLETIPWYPPVQADFGLSNEYLVDHIRDVTQGAIALAEVVIERRDIECSVETVIAGGLVHDISKLYEFDGEEATDIHDLLGHPYYGVHAAAVAGLPISVQHIILSHTDQSNVSPATIEAEIVRRADEVAASAIRLQVLDDLRNA